MSGNSNGLLEHNLITLKEVEAYLEQNENCCVVNTCGSGKTSVMATLVKDRPDKQFVILTKQKNAAQYYRKENKVFRKRNVCIVTYNQMHIDVKKGELQKYEADFYLADEAHYLGASQWKQSFEALINEWHPRLIGFTATPQRYEDQGTTHTIVDDFFDSNRAGNFTSEKLEEKGLFVKPEYVLSIYNMGNLINRQIEKILDSDIPDKKKQLFYSKLNNLQEEWDKTGSPAVILKKYLPEFMYKPKCNRILIYMSSIQKINEKKPEVDKMIHDVFPEKDIRSYVYTYQTSEDNLNNFLKEDKAHIKILYTIDKIMETIHIQDLRITIMLRPSVSNRIITQQFGRINSIGNNKKPLIIDMVGNLDKINSYSVSQPGFAEQSKKRSDGSIRLNLKLPCAQKAIDVFREIDKAAKKAGAYSYQGFAGCLSDVCYVFCRDKKVIEELLADHDLETAMKMTRPKEVSPKENIIDSIDPDKQFVMTPEQKTYAEKKMHVYTNFLERRGITDEDLCQSLYIAFCYAICRSWNKDTVYSTAYLITGMRNYYLHAMRARFLQESLKDRMKELIDPVWEENDEAMRYALLVRRNLMEALNTLSEREMKILMLQFGLLDGRPKTNEEIGRQFNISGTRVAQIGAKALRKLRHLSRFKLLRYCYI